MRLGSYYNSFLDFLKPYIPIAKDRGFTAKVGKY